MPKKDLIWFASALCIKWAFVSSRRIVSKNGRSALGVCLPHGGLLIIRSDVLKSILSTPRVAQITSTELENPIVSAFFIAV